MSTTRDDLIRHAKALLGGERALTARELVDAARALESERALRWARLLLERAQRAIGHDDPQRVLIAQRLARCTYKDPDLPVLDRLDAAERILAAADDAATSTSQETLGLAGAIQKRKWEAYGQKQYLELALALYRRGFEAPPAATAWYPGINAAYVLDQLAREEALEARKAGASAEHGETRRAEAAAIRTRILETLEQVGEDDHDWWSLVTGAEACFGLGRYDDAGRWLRRARARGASQEVPGWQLESTARQLANLHRLQAGDRESAAAYASSPAGRVLREFLGDNLAAVLGAYRGKLGLALSGGGFRAALFHIGVLARLAELDVLRHVEALSCVSGGSIIGAHYYLELRALLESKPDRLIDRRDYIDLVQRIERDFLAGVQKNIRMRMIASLPRNLRLLFSRGYSRTHRVGELYEQHIFSRVPDGNGRTPRWLNGLFVRPHGESIDFHPSFDNWRRSNKVPVLVLNATSLNTGHAWQFTASWMGEPPTAIDTDVDANDRYRRMYYREAPKPYREFRLGHAVAASSCVPGLFEPLPLIGLYPDRAVRLVDGGVHDNQGIVSLLEQNCDVIVVSDASGQMSTDPAPSDGILKVPLRSNDILMARVREAQYRELAARRRSSMLRGLMFLHLKKDLETEAVSWVGCDEPAQEADRARGPATTYGIRRDLQAALAAVRTDLDSFSDAEAYALMASGYRMTKAELGRCLPMFDDAEAPDAAWRFRAIEPALSGDAHDEPARQLERVLRVAKNRALKVWLLSPALKVAGAALVLALVALALLFAWENRAGVAFQITWGAILGRVAPLVGAALIGGAAIRVLRYRSTATQYALTAASALVGWLVAGIHLLVFDRLYLLKGRVRRPEPAQAEPRSEPARAEPPVVKEAEPVGADPTGRDSVGDRLGETLVRAGAPGGESPEPVLLGASAPRAVRPGQEFTARYVAYVKSVETEVRALLEGLSPGAATHLGLQSCRWAPGTRVTVRLEARHVRVDPPEDAFVWDGERSLLEFDCTVADDAPAGVTILRFDVFIEGIRVARLRVDLTIAATGDDAPAATIAEPARTAFASYSSEDRLRVLDRVASVRTSADLDVFLDCLSLHPGEEWKARLVEEIERRDLFLLFWSANASASKWVEWEWRTALARRGIDDIEPHPLDAVRDAPPPPELASLHFGDPLILLREAFERQPPNT